MSGLPSIRDLGGFEQIGLLELGPTLGPSSEVQDYTLVSYVRAGLSAAIGTPLVESHSLHTTIDVTVTLSAGKTATDVAVGHRAVVYGPGDVAALDRSQVIRRYPEPDSIDANPNDLVLVEFDRPELPWLFTPAAPDSGQLTPWLALVAVVDQDGDRLVESAAGANPRLLLQPSEQPRFEHAWAWAHAQVLGTHTDDLPIQLSRANPDRNLSRLLCPLHLQADTPYLAAVVPLFEAGRLAGLGERVEPTTTRARAWHCHDAVLVPVYDWFRFRTGAAADIEDLARRILPEPPPDGVGRIRLDVRDPGSGISPIPPGDVGVHDLFGPLVATRHSGTRLPNPQRRTAPLQLGARRHAVVAASGVRGHAPGTAGAPGEQRSRVARGAQRRTGFARASRVSAHAS